MATTKVGRRRSKTVKKTTARASKATKSSTQGHEFTRSLYGWITHTELASSDPDATKEWCENVLGWKFKPSVPTADGDYHLFTYSDKGGGGIRANNPPEVPGSIPYIHVRDTDAAFAKALREGAEEMYPPSTVMSGVRIAIVRAPGGVAIGFSGPSESTNGSN